MTPRWKAAIGPGEAVVSQCRLHPLPGAGASSPARGTRQCGGRLGGCGAAPQFRTATTLASCVRDGELNAARGVVVSGTGNPHGVEEAFLRAVSGVCGCTPSLNPGNTPTIGFRATLLLDAQTPPHPTRVCGRVRSGRLCRRLAKGNGDSQHAAASSKLFGRDAATQNVRSFVFPLCYRLSLRAVRRFPTHLHTHIKKGNAEGMHNGCAEG
ncbi:uncharacterized protein Tco025E_08062 [Trypanosoma conorhini]|uniref:Uncharacterized protein n=1 Tax=Trypanosoma conorhini TaxID=83891 RepID=A0A3R7NKB2_9TRYP|nr:uncharacterized protein Tco025E_08062 [Trypanosoma conorhini]RNF03907.1 hypothetical protein Tco025E_08062 [Trypanosoma conorhini]